MTKFTAKITTRLKVEIAKSKQIRGYVGQSYRPGNSMINDSKAVIKGKLKNRDIISKWDYINRSFFQNIKYVICQTLLNVLEPKSKVTKERLTDAHFDAELRYLVKDQPVQQEGITSNGFVRKN